MKIKEHLTDDQFKFQDMMLLFKAYEYWRYENINKQTFQQMEEEKKEEEKQSEDDSKSRRPSIKEKIQNKWQ